MTPIQDFNEPLKSGTRILFATPAMKENFVQGGTLLKREEDAFIVETQGKQVRLGGEVRIEIE